MSDPTWLVVIVNYRTGPAAAAAARSARDALADRGEVVVVDSASGDDSRSHISSLSGITLLELAANRGYGAALNAGAAGHQARYLLCMNADVTVTPDLFSVLQRRFDEIPRLAICAPRLQSEDGRVQPSCRLFPTYGNLLWARRSPLGMLNPGGRRRYILPEPPSFSLCDVVAGACFGMRRRVWDELKGMDERFFLYAEDTDLCFRAKAAGWLVGYDPSVTVRHAWGESTRRWPRQTARMHAESLRYYFRKHYPNRRLANGVLGLALGAHARLSGKA